MCNCVSDIYNLVACFSVLFILVFHIEKLLARLDVVFYGLNLFFHPQITRACKNYTSPVIKKIDRLSPLIETKYCSMPF